MVKLNFLKIKASVLLFLEIWLSSFPEDFLPVESGDNIGELSVNSSDYGMFILLFKFIRILINSCDSQYFDLNGDSLDTESVHSVQFPLLSHLVAVEKEFESAENDHVLEGNNEDEEEEEEKEIGISTFTQIAKSTRDRLGLKSSKISDNCIHMLENSDEDFYLNYKLKRKKLIEIIDQEALKPIKNTIKLYAILAATLSVAELSSITIDVDVLPDGIGGSSNGDGGGGGGNGESNHRDIFEPRRVFSRPIDKVFIKNPFPKSIKPNSQPTKNTLQDANNINAIDITCSINPSYFDSGTPSRDQNNSNDNNNSNMLKLAISQSSVLSPQNIAMSSHYDE